MEAIVLAGGKGTRLQSVVSDVPKPMAPVNDKPFLYYQLQYLKNQGIKRIVLSVGYKKELIIDTFGYDFQGVELDYAIEQTPLGTGGGIQLALKHCKNQEVFIVNGDTLFNIDLSLLKLAKKQKSAQVMMALKHMLNFDRFGVVDIDTEHRIIAFREKEFCAEGVFNGGIYLMEKNLLEESIFKAPFSLEQDCFQKYITTLKIYGEVFEDYFIDIGIPQDYAKAQIDFKNKF